MINFKSILLAALVAAGSRHEAAAMNYSATHLLLVFREDGLKDSEFDIGTVSNYLGLANGTVVPVSYPTQVKTNYNNTFSGVKIALIAATSSSDSLLRVWMTDADLVNSPTNLTLSKFSQPRGKIEEVGIEATAVTASNTAPYIASPTGNASSYSYIVTGGTLANIGTMNGDSAFTDEAANPATLAFYDIRPSNANPKPPSQIIGTFNWDVNGNLTFTAGPQTPLSPSEITGITWSNGVTTVWFTATNNLNYNLYSSTTVTGGWAQVAGPVAGSNNNTNFTHTTADPARFYRILTTH